jgi:hypothetical protein
MENMGIGHFKARNITNGSTFHQRDDIFGLVDKNVNLRMQLVLQHEHLGQYVWRFPDVAYFTYALKLCPGG